MTIEKGFKIDQPDLFVPWDIDQQRLTQLFAGQKLTKITDGYFTADCESLGGLMCMIGFHFEPLKNGRLNQFEFSRPDYSDLRKSYEEFQKFFEQVFGRPTHTRMGTEGFQDHLWNLGNIQIFHTIFNRYGPEERLGILKNA